MLDPLVYEARRTRAVFIALVLGLGLVGLVVQGGGATGAEPSPTAARVAPQGSSDADASRADPSRSSAASAQLEAPATLLVSAEETTTTTATTAPSNVQSGTTPSSTAPLTTVAPTTQPAPPPPTTAAAPSNLQSGTATWYEGGSSSGCAHLTLPKGTVVTVTAVSSGRSVSCTVDDRGPFGRHIIDLSPSGFQALAPLSSGVVSVRITW